MASLASLIVRIGAEDAGLSKTLKDIGVQGKSLDDQLSKIGNRPMGVEAERSALKLSEALNAVRDNTAKIAATADNAARGIDRLGGVTVLTSRDLNAMARTVRDGIDAYRALGQQAPKDLQRVADAITAQQAALRNTTTATSGLSTALGSLSGLLSVGAVISFGHQILAAGDSIQKMADQTGLSTAEVQKLQFIAGQSGTSIESLVGAVQNLQVRLGDENTGAAGAMAKLGIEADSFAKLNTYQQMTLLGDAIKGIKDPTEQASVSAAIFGKTWKEILPAIKSGMKETGEQASIMSDDVVRATDRIGDAMIAAKQTTIVWGASFVTAIEEAGFQLGNFLSMFDPSHFGLPNTALLKLEGALNDKTGIAGAMSKIPPVAKDVAAQIGSIALSSAKATEIGNHLNRQGLESIDVNTRAAAALAKHNAEMEKFRNSVQRLSFKVFIDDTNRLNAVIPDLSAHTAEMARKFAEARGEVGNLASAWIVLNRVETETGAIIGGTVIPMFSKLPNVVAQATQAIANAVKTISVSFGDKLTTNLKTTLKDIPQTIVSAFTGGGGAEGAGKAIGASLGAAVGGAVGGPIGAAIGSALGALAGGLFGKLFNNPEKEINPIREAFVQLNGGLKALNERAHDAGVTLTAMLNAKNPEQYKKAIDDLNAALQFQDDAMKTLDATVAKYGFTIEELGPKFSQQKLSEGFLELFQDTKVLTSAGIDYDNIIRKQADAYEELVKSAIATGSAIPEQLRPILQRMAELGLLTDASGAKMEDLGQLTFAETLDRKFTTLIDTIQKLADAISRGLGTAINSLPNEKMISIGFDLTDPNVRFLPGDVFEPSAAATGGLVVPGGIQRFARGGRVLPFLSRGTDTVPAMLTPGEIVLNADQQAAVSARMRAGADAFSQTTNNIDVYSTVYMTSEDAKDPDRVIQIYIDGLRRDTGMLRTSIESIVKKQINAE